MGPRGLSARTALAQAAPRLTADQAESALARMREAGRDQDDDTVTALLDRLEQTAGKRRANAVRKWFGSTGDVDERRATRQARGTVAEQREAYADYVEQEARRIEAATRGQTLNPRARAAGVMTIDALLTANPATIRRHASEETLRYFGQNGPPLSFDAWRYANIGARDARAVASWQRRTGSYFSEHG